MAIQPSRDELSWHAACSVGSHAENRDARNAGCAGRRVARPAGGFNAACNRSAAREAARGAERGAAAASGAGRAGMAPRRDGMGRGTRRVFAAPVAREGEVTRLSLASSRDQLSPDAVKAKLREKIGRGIDRIRTKVVAASAAGAKPRRLEKVRQAADKRATRCWASSRAPRPSRRFRPPPRRRSSTRPRASRTPSTKATASSCLTTPRADAIRPVLPAVSPVGP